VDRFAGDADDLGLQRGDYYDISAFVSADTRIRMRAAPGLGSEDRVLFDNVQLIAWNDAPEIAWHEVPAQGSVQSGWASSGAGLRRAARGDSHRRRGADPDRLGRAA